MNQKHLVNNEKESENKRKELLSQFFNINE